MKEEEGEGEEEGQRKESQVVIHHVHLERRKTTMHESIPPDRWGC